MGLQMVETYVPKEFYDKVVLELKQFSRQGAWKENKLEERVWIRMVISDEDVEEVLNFLEKISREHESFETILYPVTSYFSSQTLEEAEEKVEEESEESSDEEEGKKLLRASRQELIHMIDDKSTLTMNYTLLIIFSAVVATAGFIKDSEAVVIGAMVIAPLISPAISMSFASILGDLKRLGRASFTLLIGFIIIFSIAIIFGLFFGESTLTNQYISRTRVSLADIFLALASGAAGALSILNRLSGNLVGVMVAVALLPPSVTFGLSIGQRHWDDTYGSFLLITTNVTCILLSAIIIFLMSGIQPKRWKEEPIANVSRIFSIVITSAMFIALFIVVVFGLELK
ncbi:TIGR00341 family protein [Halalkalibacillus sediminis]|uniref:TIGR00341 family protein n=1 Tax=Halalkalibacillus sediminis TaxID=2018042 RepID=A0A2I0QV76_9BACI|nr:TIGR00341 family protein [Halalkalibacillus sediminis]